MSIDKVGVKIPETARVGVYEPCSCSVFCPDCGDIGPHDVQRYMGEREYACSSCGMQHVVPEAKPGHESSHTHPIWYSDQVKRGNIIPK